MLVEIKKREYTTDFTDKWLLETDKVNRCISIAQDMNRKPVFVNITGDDVRWNGHGIDIKQYGNVQIWDMHDCSDEMTVNSPKCTCDDRGRRDKEYKVFDVKNAKVNKPRKRNEK